MDFQSSTIFGKCSIEDVSQFGLHHLELLGIFSKSVVAYKVVFKKHLCEMYRGKTRQNF